MKKEVGKRDEEVRSLQRKGQLGAEWGLNIGPKECMCALGRNEQARGLRRVRHTEEEEKHLSPFEILGR